MSIATVQVLGEQELDRVTRLLAGIEGGVDSALSNAVKRTASTVRTLSTEAIRDRYAISAKNIRAEQNIKVTYSYSDGVQAIINFAGHKIPLYRYDGTSPQVPAVDNSRLIQIMTGQGWRTVHPSVPAKGHQLKGTAPSVQTGGFVARMHNSTKDHIGIFRRIGADSDSPIQEIMGSSVPQMLGNEEVGEQLSEKAAEKFNERMEHEIDRILNGWGR